MEPLGKLYWGLPEVRRRRLFLYLVVVALGVRAAPAGSWQPEVLNASGPEAGFRLPYQVKPEARSQFAVWKASHAEDPLGSASEAAGYLFEECYRQGLLTSEFFLDNQRFLGKIAIKPAPERVNIARAGRVKRAFRAGIPAGKSRSSTEEKDGSAVANEKKSSK